MKTSDKIELLSKLKCVLVDILDEKVWTETTCGLSQELYDSLIDTINREHIYNGWFTRSNILKAFEGIASWLDPLTLENWLSNYKVTSTDKPKTIAVIMAGNIPLVGFHDFISVLLSGHKILAKLSSDDKHLFPKIIEVLAFYDANVIDYIETTDRLAGFDAVIATGSDNSATYFNTYFGKYPHIIRKNRTSIAVLGGTESKSELKQLGHDIFDFFGLGCRNVTQLLIPQDFVLDHFFESIFEFDPIINHNKYANNYDYNKAVYLLNLQELLDNGFILLKEDESLHSPLGVLFYKRYNSKEEIAAYINGNQEKIQAIVGKDYIKFGQSQCPSLTDYADGVDTMAFLTSL